MRLHVIDIISRMGHCFWQSLKTLRGTIVAIAFAIGIVYPATATWLTGFNSAYPAVTVGFILLFAFWLFVKASYERDCERDAQCNAKIEAAVKSSIGAENARARNEAITAQLATARQQIDAYVALAPLAEPYDRNAGYRWSTGACDLLRLTVKGWVAQWFWSGSDTINDIQRGVGTLRGIAGGLKAEHLLD